MINYDITIDNIILLSERRSDLIQECVAGLGNTNRCDGWWWEGYLWMAGWEFMTL